MANNNNYKCNEVCGPKNFCNAGVLIFGILFTIFTSFYFYKPFREPLLFVLIAFCIIHISLRLVFIVYSIFKIKHQTNIHYYNISTPKLFTILIPLYHETENVIISLYKSIQNINYPKNMLDVKIIVEEDDKSTIAFTTKIMRDFYFDIITVPHSLPKTKPKACNYAMQFAKGDIIGIYDAEDIPHPLQIKAANDFFQNNPDFDCVQFPLLYYNENTNLLTRFFQMEYLSWFLLTIPSLTFFNKPIALGGTSNFIRRSVFNKIGLWSAFNVTEDAELGMRMFLNKIKTAYINLPTMEEAPFNLKNWINQRKRWIKGFNQTYFFYFFKFFNKKCSILDKLVFYFLYGSSAVGFLINILILIFELYFRFLNTQVNQSLQFCEILLLTITIIFCLISWYFTLKYSNKNKWLTILYSAITPFYFILHCYACIFAIKDLITKPFYWNKTIHYGKK